MLDEGDVCGGMFMVRICTGKQGESQTCNASETGKQDGWNALWHAFGCAGALKPDAGAHRQKPLHDACGGVCGEGNNGCVV
jgi:hypothetical protein